MIPKIIKDRTLKGKFARAGSSGTRARRYDPTHARRYRKNVAGPVDLYITGQLHGSIKGKSRTTKNGVFAYGYIQGADAQQKFQWLQKQGAGRSRIKRRFMYLTKTEASKVARAMIRVGSK